MDSQNNINFGARSRNKASFSNGCRQERAIVPSQRFSYAVYDSIQYLNPWWTYVSLCIAYVFIALAVEHYVITEDVIANSLARKMHASIVSEALAYQNSLSWLTYLYIPLVVALQAFFPALCLNVKGLFSESQHGILPLNIALKYCMNASIIFLYYPLFMLLLARIIGGIEIVDDFNQLDYFSLRGMLSTTSQSAWWSYPLRIVNIFEFLFWLTLAAAISHRLKTKFTYGFSYVATSYGVGLVMWMLIVGFIALSKT